MTVLVTGASGFVGTAVCQALAVRGLPHRAGTRRDGVRRTETDAVAVGDIDERTDWSRAVEGVSSVIHLAARVHVMRETAADGLAEFRRVNVEGTERLARAAAAAGARRFVYVSSIKVNGEATSAVPFRATDAPDPKDPYGISKWEAEAALARVAADTGIEVVIVRPPLVYGRGVRGNFLRLLRLAQLGIPLPLAAANNRRSLVFVRNLADALVRCLVHPAASGRTFLVSDGEDLSTAELFTRLARALGRPPRLFWVPRPLMTGLARLTGRSAEIQRLFGSLEVDASPLRRDLDWTPPHSMEAGLSETATWFKSR